MTRLNFSSTQKKQVLDITDDVQHAVADASFHNGVCHLFLLHTSAALTTADLDPGTDLDLLDAYDAMVPDLPYRHPHDPSHVGDHILSAMIGTDVSVPVLDGSLVLGTWQRIVLMEFNGPREREVVLSAYKS